MTYSSDELQAARETTLKAAGWTFKINEQYPFHEAWHTPEGIAYGMMPKITRSMIKELLEEVDGVPRLKKQSFMNELMIVLNVGEASAMTEILSATFATVDDLTMAFGRMEEGK